MPTYAYACKDCHHAFDVQQSFSDDSLTECPECSGKLRKKFNSVGVVFKGSGFYRTDSRESKGNSTVSAGSGASESSGGKKDGESSGSSSTESSTQSTPTSSPKDASAPPASANKSSGSPAPVGAR